MGVKPEHSLCITGTYGTNPKPVLRLRRRSFFGTIRSRSKEEAVNELTTHLATSEFQESSL